MILSKYFLGVDDPNGIYHVDLPQKKSVYQIETERIRRLEQLANEQYHSDTATISCLVIYKKET
jgi:UDP-N-acetylglucosamine pyrophosphorylase